MSRETGIPDPLRQTTLTALRENLARPEGTPFSSLVRLCTEHPALGAQVIESLEQRRRYIEHELKQCEVDIWAIRGDPRDGPPYPVDRWKVIPDPTPIPDDVEEPGPIKGGDDQVPP